MPCSLTGTSQHAPISLLLSSSGSPESIRQENNSLPAVVRDQKALLNPQITVVQITPASPIERTAPARVLTGSHMTEHTRAKPSRPQGEHSERNGPQPSHCALHPRGQALPLSSARAAPRPCPRPPAPRGRPATPPLPHPATAPLPSARLRPAEQRTGTWRRQRKAPQPGPALSLKPAVPSAQPQGERHCACASTTRLRAPVCCGRGLERLGWGAGPGGKGAAGGSGWAVPRQCVFVTGTNGNSVLDPSLVNTSQNHRG